MLVWRFGNTGGQNHVWRARESGRGSCRRVSSTPASGESSASSTVRSASSARRCAEQSFLGGAYIIGSVLAPFAGQKTELSAVVSALVDLKADRYFFLVTALLAGGGWWQERRKRRKLIESWGPYVRSLEEKIDPNRSSSGLLISGEPRKEDADVL